tara:strand:+ start:1986 stop:2921 length:936 start_codon:yes stop_codon:yes gene_type:complete
MPHPKEKDCTAAKIINASAESFTYFLNQLVANRLHLQMNYFSLNFMNGCKATLSFFYNDPTYFCKIKLNKVGQLQRRPKIVAIHKAFAYLCENLGITPKHLESAKIIKIKGVGVKNNEYNVEEIASLFANLPTLIDFPRAISRQEPAISECNDDKHSPAMANQLRENVVALSSPYQLFGPLGDSALTAQNRLPTPALPTGATASNSSPYQLFGPMDDYTVTAQNHLPIVALANAMPTPIQPPLTRSGGSVQTSANTDTSLFSTPINIDNFSAPTTQPSAALPLRDPSSNCRNNSSTDSNTITTAFTFGMNI